MGAGGRLEELAGNEVFDMLSEELKLLPLEKSRLKKALLSSVGKGVPTVAEVPPLLNHGLQQRVQVELQQAPLRSTGSREADRDLVCEPYDPKHTSTRVRRTNDDLVCEPFVPLGGEQDVTRSELAAGQEYPQ